MNKVQIGSLVAGVCMVLGVHATPTHAALLPLSQYTLLEEIITSLRNVLQALTISSAPLTSSSTQCIDLKRTMTVGATGEEVVALQNFLVQIGYLDSASATGFYGSMTAAAVGKLQLERGILKNPTALGYGITGPRTRTALACAPTGTGTTGTSTATTTPPRPPKPPTVSTSTGTTTPAQPRARTSRLLSQPSISDINDYYYLRKHPSSAGDFYLVQWQSNPHTQSGSNIPVGWKVGDKTGFYPKNATSSQLGMRNVVGSTAVQAEGRTVGIYLNSKDLIYGSSQFKLGIFPAMQFSTKDPIYPFTYPQNEVRGSVDMQVPTVSSAARPGQSNAHIVHYFVFTDPKTKVNISYAVGLFLHNQKLGGGGVHFDEQSRSIVVANPLGGNDRITKLGNSELRQSQPWKGYKSFAYSLNEAQFAQGLRDAAAQFPELGVSTNPKDYYLKSSHLNSEIHYEAAPAELGLSVQRFRVDLLKYEVTN